MLWQELVGQQEKDIDALKVQLQHKDFAIRGLRYELSTCKEEPRETQWPPVAVRYNATYDQLCNNIAVSRGQLHDAQTRIASLLNRKANDDQRVKAMLQRLEATERQLQEREGEIATLSAELSSKEEEIKTAIQTRNRAQLPAKTQEYVDHLQRQLLAANEDLARLQGLTDRNKDDEYDDDSRLSSPTTTARPCTRQNDAESRRNSCRLNVPGRQGVGTRMSHPLGLLGPGPSKKSRRVSANASGGAAFPSVLASALGKPFHVSAKPPGRTRKRGRRDELEAELADLETDCRTLAKRQKRRRRSTKRDLSTDTSVTGGSEESSDPVSTSGRYRDCAVDFEFIAVYAYDGKGTVDRSCHSSDLRGKAQELWNRIELVQTDIWEAKHGSMWQLEFAERMMRTSEPICVTRKCLKKRTLWGSGRGPGLFACQHCVEEGMPCFTWTRNKQAKTDEFRLLPLHRDDHGDGTRGGKDGCDSANWICDEKEAVIDSDYCAEE